MTSIILYPLQPHNDEMVPDLDFMVAIVHPGQGRGDIDVLVPTFEADIRRLFEQPLTVYAGPGQTRLLQPWTPEALQHILKSSLYSVGLHGEVQP